MPNVTQHGGIVAASKSVYRPTSLDFINRPNPIEPQSESHRHPLNGTLTPQQLSLASNVPSAQLRQGFLNRLLEPSHHSNSTQRHDPTSGEPLAKRRKSRDSPSAIGRTEGLTASSNNASLDLPKPSGARHGQKRLLLPPTLSGLHQPPPNAGLLPSISTEKPATAVVADDSICAPNKDDVELNRASDGGTSEPSPDQDRSSIKKTVQPPQCHSRLRANDSAEPKTKRNRWGEAETACLLKGVARFGIGNWTKILKCEDYHFERRTALDLKDRFRVCCPNDYGKPNSSSPAVTIDKRMTAEGSSKATTAATKATSFCADSQSLVVGTNTKTSSSRSDRKSSQELQDLGIVAPFAPTKRRKRHTYTMAEDMSLLQGFNKYGNAWAAIRDDDSLGLSGRTATDLRDRMRTRYPDEYKDAGLVGRPRDFPKRPHRGNKDSERVSGKAGNDLPSDSARSEAVDNGEVAESRSASQDDTESTQQPIRPPNQIGIQQKAKEVAVALPNQQAKKATNPALPSTFLPFDPDGFFGTLMPFEIDESYSANEVAERITLDRGILDWPLDNNNQRSVASNASGVSNANIRTPQDSGTRFETAGGIDPAMTLVKLPFFTSARGANSGGSAPLTQASFTSSQISNGAGKGALPSLAAITALAASDGTEADVIEQLELPSLMLGGLDGDVHRGGGLGLDELLS